MNTVNQIEADLYIIRLKLFQICEQWDVIRKKYQVLQLTINSHTITEEQSAQINSLKAEIDPKIEELVAMVQDIINLIIINTGSLKLLINSPAETLTREMLNKCLISLFMESGLVMVELLLDFYKTPQYNLFDSNTSEKSKNNVSMSASELELLMQNMGDCLYAYTHEENTNSTTPTEEQRPDTRSSTP